MKAQLSQPVELDYQKLRLVRLDVGQKLSRSVSIRSLKRISDGDGKDAFFAVFDDSAARFRVSKDYKIEQLEQFRLEKPDLSVFDAEPRFTVYQRKTKLFRQEEEQDANQDAQQSERCEYVLYTEQTAPRRVDSRYIDFPV